MRKICTSFLLSFVLSLSLVTGGCASLQSNLPKVISAVTDAMLVIQTIESFVNIFFASHDNPALHAKVSAAINNTRAALDVALRATSGAHRLTQGEIDVAFADFRDAYANLLVILAPIGVNSGDTLRATPGTLSVPEPLALKLKA